MRRRDVLAGIASVGALGGAGAATVYGVPSVTDSGDDGPRHEPVEIATVEAPGSERGALQVPDTGGVTFVDLFATTCTVCQEQMSTLGEAYDRVGDDVTFVSVTNESERVADDEQLAEWWREYDGRWTVGRDATSELIVHYGTTTPTAVVFDAEGHVQWEESGQKTLEEILDGIDRARRE